MASLNCNGNSEDATSPCDGSLYQFIFSSSHELIVVASNATIGMILLYFIIITIKIITYSATVGKSE